MKITVTKDCFRLKQPFTIARGSRTFADVITVEIEDQGVVGRGECVPYQRYGETLTSVTEVIRCLPLPLNRDMLQEILEPGAARNAVDCALWDLEAKKNGKAAWQMAEVQQLKPLISTYTISLNSPDEMYKEARDNKDRPLLKVKLGGNKDIARIEAIRKAAPKTKIVVDANESFNEDDFPVLLDKLVELGISMVEQPFPAYQDQFLESFTSPIPICADESCHDRQSLDDCSGKYSMINIKLDKTGGLTEALHLLREGQERGFDIMVGCMVGSSLAIAPAMLVAQYASIVDLDGPLLLADDRPHALSVEGSVIFPPVASLWG